ncbi:MAG: quinone oxidoreductase [Rhodospirillaceae bacterium]|nr:quinone oxidoreductase [Rhodospirillaceae bacterium]
MAAQRWIAAAPGPPAAMRWTAFAPPPPGPGEIQVRQAAVGVNMIDTYVISGAYRIDPYPLTPGVEGAGTVTAVGAGVTDFKVGDRAGYGGPPLGAYATVRNMWPGYAVKLPDALSFVGAAAIMIAGLTTQMMVKRVYPVGRGTKVLVQAAAGSTGEAIVRWAAHLGAEVFGTVGSAAKAARARAAGCAHVINYREEDYAEAVLRLTNGRGVDVSYDGIAKDTFTGAFKALTPTGMFVTYGQASGPLPPIDLSAVPVTFSNFIARPSVFSFNADRATFLASMAEVFKALADGVLDPTPGRTYPLAEAPRALDDLVNRRTEGSVVLTV